MNTHAIVNWEAPRATPLSTEACAKEFPASPRFADPSSAVSGHNGFAAEAVGILENVRQTIESDPAKARAAAIQLVTFLTRSPGGGTASARGGLAPWQKRKIDRYLKDNLGEALYVETIADQVSLSVSHFCRAFKESFGTSPHMYIIRLRLGLAQHMMLATAEPLSQIALACGLADQSHLSRLFRNEIGDTPAAWRKRNLTDAQGEARHRGLREGRSVCSQVATN
jgi:AraC family transcriptional regulator